MDDLAAACAGARGPLVLVSNEVGFGIVPDNALARRFRDARRACCTSGSPPEPTGSCSWWRACRMIVKERRA